MENITETMAPQPKYYRNTEGHLYVRNLSAYWLPELTVQKKIGGTLYVVDGSYEGTETLDRKLRRIMARNMEDCL